MRLTPRSRAAAAAAVLALAGGAGAFVATRPTPSLTDGSLRVSPARLVLQGGTPGSLDVSNRGSTPITIEVSGPAWTAVDPVSALIPTDAIVKVEVLAITQPDARDATLKITAGADAVSVPITLEGTLTSQAPASGPKILIDRFNIDFGETTSAVERTIANIGSEPLTWSIDPQETWLRAEPPSGTTAPGAITTVRLTVDRGGPDPGQHAGSILVASNGGSLAWHWSMIVGDRPILHLLDLELDFGVGGQRAVKTKTFSIRNEGRQELRYQASVARVFLKLGKGASGAIAPGETAQVELTFDYRETLVSYDWEAEVPITSNGGTATLRVVGVSDWSGPTLVVGSNQMKFAHDHCSGGTCERYRHLRATVEEPHKVILVEAAFRICTGSDETPTCDEWRLAGKSRRISGDVYKGVYEMEVGPLPKTCVPGVGVSINYRFRLADSLRNSSLRPGSATYYGYLHCSRAT